MEKDRLRVPTWKECEDAVEDGTSSPLEGFIYVHGGDSDESFRDMLSKAIRSDRARIKELEEALAFYAYEENWKESLFGPWLEIHAHLDKGDIARAVLSPHPLTPRVMPEDCKHRPSLLAHLGVLRCRACGKVLGRGYNVEVKNADGHLELSFSMDLTFSPRAGFYYMIS